MYVCIYMEHLGDARKIIYKVYVYVYVCIHIWRTWGTSARLYIMYVYVCMYVYIYMEQLGGVHRIIYNVCICMYVYIYIYGAPWGRPQDEQSGYMLCIYVYICMHIYIYIYGALGGLHRQTLRRGEHLSCWTGGRPGTAGSDGVVMGHAGAHAGGQSRPGGPGLAESPLMTVMEPCRS